MSRSGTWFVMCPSAGALPMSELFGRLSIPEDYSPELEGEQLVLSVPDEHGGKPVTVTIGRSTAEHVASESREFADRHGDERPDRDTIAQLDARYEIEWPLAKSDVVFDAVFWIASQLKKLTDGVTYNVTNDMFVSSPR